MNWTPAVDYDDAQLAHFAARRHFVRLANGRICKLIRWPVPGRRLSGTTGRFARLETNAGTRFTVHCREIIEISDIPEGSAHE